VSNVKENVIRIVNGLPPEPFHTVVKLKQDEIVVPASSVSKLPPSSDIVDEAVYAWSDVPEPYDLTKGLIFGESLAKGATVFTDDPLYDPSQVQIEPVLLEQASELSITEMHEAAKEHFAREAEPAVILPEVIGDPEEEIGPAFEPEGTVWPIGHAWAEPDPVEPFVAAPSVLPTTRYNIIHEPSDDASGFGTFASGGAVTDFQPVIVGEQPSGGSWLPKDKAEELLRLAMTAPKPDPKTAHITIKIGTAEPIEISVSL